MTARLGRRKGNDGEPTYPMTAQLDTRSLGWLEEESGRLRITRSRILRRLIERAIAEGGLHDDHDCTAPA